MLEIEILKKEIREMKKTKKREIIVLKAIEIVTI